MNRLPCDSNFLMEEAQELLTSNSEDRENCLFECSMIFLKQGAKRLSLEFVDPVSVLSSGRKIFKQLLSWWKNLKKRLTFNWRAVFFLQQLTCSWRIKRCCVFQSQNWKTLTKKNFLLEPLLSRAFGLLGLGIARKVPVKITISVRFSKNSSDVSS